MPDNVRPQAVRFANEKVRVFADALLTAVLTAREFKAHYDANSLDTLFPPTPDRVADGSEVDGRPPVNNQSVRALYAAATDLLTWAAGSAIPNATAREQQLRAIAVNPSSRI